MGELAVALDVVEASPRVRAASAGIEGWSATLGVPGAPVATMLLPHAITTISDAPGEVTLRRRSVHRRRGLTLRVALSTVLGAATALAVIVLASAGSGGGGDGTVSPSSEPAGPVDASAVPTSDGTAALRGVAESSVSEHAPADALISVDAVRVAVPVDASVLIDAVRAAMPVDASISIDASRIAVPIDASPAPLPGQVQKTRNDRQPKEDTTYRGSDKKMGSGSSKRIDYGD